MILGARPANFGMELSTVSSSKSAKTGHIKQSLLCASHIRTFGHLATLVYRWACYKMAATKTHYKVR